MKSGLLAWAARRLRPPALAGRRLTLLADPIDAHHVDLCFLRYFDRLARPCGPTWELVAWEAAGPALFAGCDLAIFCRPRFPQSPGLLDDCQAAGVPALVMIDDNWIAAGEEYPRYRGLFAPGCAALEVFLDAVRRAEATLVYNPVLAAELAPRARRVVELPTNVDLALFSAPAMVRRPAGRLLYGFAGSPRFETSGFAALAAFAATHPEIDLLYIGHELPTELAGVDPARLEFVPYLRRYADYARALAERRPDVLIAPLDATRFAASKCPNKFLDIAAAQAAGVYSRVEPYLSAVADGVTGLLVDNRVESWCAAFDRLRRDAELRRSLARRALGVVRRRFATEVVLPRFVALVEELAVRRRGR